MNRTYQEGQWHWMMDWCKAKGLAPAHNENWDRAEKAYDEYKVVSLIKSFNKQQQEGKYE